MISPACAGLSCVTGAPATLAQHSVLLLAETVTAPVVPDVGPAELPVKVMPLPSGPGTLAVSTMQLERRRSRGGHHFFGLALINAISASRMDCSVSLS